MRNSFVKALTELAEEDKNLVLITGDLGFGVLKNYWETYPEQFINAGIAEQFMVGMATGMALEGKTAFVYSIGNFPTLRCLEQIRNDAAYHKANVKIVCVGGGFSYGALGMSHHATEDIAIMRALPDVVILSPADAFETEAATKAMYSHEGVCYIRIGRGGERKIHSGSIDFKIGKAIEIIEGKRVAVFSTGGIMEQAYLAVEELNGMGISTGLYSFPTVKPIDKETIIKCARDADLIVTVEEHNIMGGFGSAVAEVLACSEGVKARQTMIGLNDTYSSVVGTQQYLLDYYGLSKPHIVSRVLSILK